MFKSAIRQRSVFAAILSAVLFTPSLLGAQETEAPDTVVGPPQLREFQLPGTRTTPAPEQTEPVTVAPPPPPVDAPAATKAPEQKAPAPAERTAAPAPKASPAPKSTGEQGSESVRTDSPVAPPAAEVTATQPQALPDHAAPLTKAPEPATETIPAPVREGFPWYYLLLAALGGALIAALAIRQFRARVADRDFDEALGDAEEVREEPALAQPTQPAPRPVPANVAPPSPERPSQPVVAPVARAQSPAPAPAAPPSAAPAGTVGIQLRPWLKLEFVPDRAAATDAVAALEYELVIKNVGNAAARNIRIEARMFNAGAQQDQEITAFFRETVPLRGNNAIEAIPPRKGARMRNVVTMPKQDVREVTVQGRRLFIPMVAVNVIYEWGDGRTGQTSMSYLVGREPETPSEKMGAFRLDLGPRVYRSLGQRPNNLAVQV